MNTIGSLTCYVTGKLRKGQGPAEGLRLFIGIIITIAFIIIVIYLVSMLMGWNIFSGGGGTFVGGGASGGYGSP